MSAVASMVKMRLRYVVEDVDRHGSRTVWDRKRLDEAFEALPGGDSDNQWDDAAA
jgi:hypothetical protein